MILHVGAEHRVQGLTTAAALWASAILGIVCGVADFTLGTIAVAFTLAVLLLGGPCEEFFGRALRVPVEDERHG